MNCRRSLSIVFLAVLALGITEQSLAEPSDAAIDTAIERNDLRLALELTDQGLEKNPGSAELRFKRAQLLGYLGRHEEALRGLESLRSEFPFDVDYSLARAQTLDRLGRDNDALEELVVATGLAPYYEDVWQLRYKILSRNPEAATELDKLRRESADRFPTATWWQVPSEDDNAQWNLLAGAAHEALSNGFPSWDNQFVEITREHAAHPRLGLRLDRNVRFAASDVSVGLSAEHSWSSDWFAGIDLAAADNPDFLPELGYGGHIGRSLPDGWGIDLRYRRREYATAAVTSLTGTVEKYLADFRIAYSLGLSRLDGASNVGNHTVSLNWYYGDESSVGIAVNTGKEAESIGNGQVVESDVRGVAITGRRPLTDRIAVQWWLGTHEQGDFYRRQFLGMAVSIRL